MPALIRAPVHEWDAAGVLERVSFTDQAAEVMTRGPAGRPLLRERGG